MNIKQVEQARSTIYTLMTDLMMLSEEELRHLSELLIDDAVEEVDDVKSIVCITGMATMVQFVATNKGRLQ